jgi:transposase
LWVRLAREIPYPVEQVRSITLLCEGGRLLLDMTAEVPVAVYPAGEGPDLGRVAGVDVGIIHPYAVAGVGGEALLVSGRAMRAEHRMHLADTKARHRAVARRARRATATRPDWNHLVTPPTPLPDLPPARPRPARRRRGRTLHPCSR